MTKGRSWTRNEIVLTVELYCRMPFGRIHNKNPEIVGFSQKIGRTPSSVALKMANFASLDVTLERTGLKNYSKLDKEIWGEFFANPDAFLANAYTLSKSYFYSQDTDDDPPMGFREGEDYEVVVKARKNQNYFRQMILAAYNGKCAITKIDSPELLIASHIVPWSVSEQSRVDPRNGICLNALHDKAFDRGLISFDEKYRILVSSQLTGKHDFFDNCAGKNLALPSRFLPSLEFIRYHRENIFVY